MQITPFSSFLGYPRHLRSSGILVIIFSNMFYATNIVFFFHTAFNKLVYTYLHFYDRWQINSEVQKSWKVFCYPEFWWYMKSKIYKVKNNCNK